MWRDPVVDEIRRIREELAERFDHDIDRILQDAQRRQALRGDSLVRRPPRPVPHVPLSPPATDAESPTR